MSEIIVYNRANVVIRLFYTSHGERMASRLRLMGRSRGWSVMVRPYMPEES